MLAMAHRGLVASSHKSISRGRSHCRAIASSPGIHHSSSTTTDCIIHAWRSGRTGTKDRRTRHYVRLAAASTSTSNPDLSIMQWTGDAEQVEALGKLRDAMAATEFADVVTEEQMRWFLLDRKMQVDAAEDKLVKMLTWRKEFGADSITTTDVAQEAATGKAYLHTHYDVQERPVIVVRAAKHIKDAAPLLHSQQLCVYTLERALEKLPEGQDTVLGIFDLRGFQSKNADMGFVKFMVDIFFTYYPKRLSQVLFVDAPWIFKPGWEMMKPWLKKYAALVRFVSADEVRREYFTQETLPDDFKPPGFPGNRPRT